MPLCAPYSSEILASCHSGRSDTWLIHATKPEAGDTNALGFPGRMWLPEDPELLADPLAATSLASRGGQHRPRMIIWRGSNGRRAQPAEPTDTGLPRPHRPRQRAPPSPWCHLPQRPRRSRLHAPAPLHCSLRPFRSTRSADHAAGDGRFCRAISTAQQHLRVPTAEDLDRTCLGRS